MPPTSRRPVPHPNAREWITAEGWRRILESVAAGSLSPEAALGRLQTEWPVADLGFARLDTLREARTGVPEVVFGEGKAAADLLAIAQRLLAAHGRVLVTRVAPEAHDALARWRPDLRWNERARTVVVSDRPVEPFGSVLVVAAGTTDLPVAEEVAETLAFCGSAVRRLTDVGVAGLHRLLAALPLLRASEVVVAVAGMEGTLPGVISGLTDRPVIGVPTSVGYGVAAGGRAALRTMLASCSPGLAVVNIDNGFGGAILAHRINVRAARPAAAAEPPDGAGAATRPATRGERS